MTAQPTPAIPTDRLILSVERSAELLALSEDTVLNLVYTGQIRAKRLSQNGIGITRQALLDYVTQATSGAMNEGITSGRRAHPRTTSSQRRS